MLDEADGDGYRLALTATGRARVVPPQAEPLAGDDILGGIRFPKAMAEADRVWQMARDLERQISTDIARAMTARPAAEVHEELTRIGYSLIHMAPVLFYVLNRTYSNLGAYSNLPGKSIRVNSPTSLLNVLRDTPVPEWAAEDAVFVACLSALLRSGPAVRVEEFNGVQLTPDRVETFLMERIEAYGGLAPDLGHLDRLSRLNTLAEHCSRLRHELADGGALFYRTINGLTLHKREHVLLEPITYAEVPPAVHAVLADLLGRPVEKDFGPAGEALRAIVAGFRLAPAVKDFTTPFEDFLHQLLTAVANGTASDVSMGRGPRALAALSRTAAPADVQLKMGTSEFYCCVTPSEAFDRRFADDRDQLVRALSAYSSRMRYNTWHYLPHTFGLTGRTRDDWFFAPTMPDVTEWSDQHHTGHVMFGVRYAIRVPIGIHFDGGYRPGLFDLRLMRTDGPAYRTEDLRSAVAVGRLLGELHQAMAADPPLISDFGNDWYRRFYG
ncbi:hypothetical protein [Micromonospora sp. WMMD1155]|uniref:hypothetical protein n=1 Tax=Micromonospora sp. WMMD1155 TaxID=3016094 RepID=UPI00249C627D|nr:hypothetical protein [Micromonospora sp. WMMD1155]WFE54841.1 hypothetical protein O7617_32765 [Micromonospora sp. WMMD1155]